MPGSIKIDDGAGRYTILTNGGSLGSDKTITIPNTTGTMALTSDIPAATTPGMTKVGDTDFSGASDATFDSVFSSTYRNYKVLIDIQAANNNTNFQLQFRDSSGYLTGSNYGVKSMYALSSSNANNYTSGYNITAGNFGVLLSGMGLNTHYGFYIDIWGPNLAEKTSYAGSGSNANGHIFHSSGAYTVATVLTGIKFYQSAGNISGSIQIYGYDT